MHVRKNARWAGTVLVAALALAWAGLASPALAKEYEVPEAPAEFQELKVPEMSARELKNGKRQYKGKCADCHGDEGQGDPEEPHVVAFTDKAWMSTRSDGQLFYIVKFGAGEEYEMEAFGPESDYGMSDKKIWRIIAYIRTLAE